MPAGVLWRVALQTTPEAEEAVSEILARIFNAAVSSYTELRTSTTRVETYLASRPENIRQSTEQICAALAELRANGMDVGTGRLTLRRLPAKNWAESWKRHFQPLEIGRRLLLKPSWSRCKPGKGQELVVLDPGLSFGTGHHPTTGFCLEQLVKFRREEVQSFLDVGTGSGVLAIAAARLGYRPVVGFDVDGESIRSAKANARRNGLGRRIEFGRRALGKEGTRLGWQRFSAVCANLTSDLLVAHRDRLFTWLESGGLLVLAGILNEEFRLVQSHYERAGLRLVASRRKGEWRSGSFQSIGQVASGPLE